ncbi:MAG: hypothetical protein LBQ48_03870 [Oscillospiraceae bacterium]|nr:hypothetical protein [Oscillospiraceae bacterium]
MARYTNEIATPVPPLSLAQPISDYLTKEGFTYKEYEGRRVWKKGVGIMTAPQFIEVYYGETSIQLHAYLKYPILPGVYVGEMGITGFFGALPKSLLKQRVSGIEQYIYSLWQQPNS